MAFAAESHLVEEQFRHFKATLNKLKSKFYLAHVGQQFRKGRAVI
jgi:hypothetical protein